MGRMEPVFWCEKLDKWWFRFYFSPNVPVSSATLASAHSWGTFCGLLLCNLMSLSPILCFVSLNIIFISVNTLRLDLSFGMKWMQQRPVLQAQNIQHIVLISGFTSSNIGIWDKYWQKTGYDLAKLTQGFCCTFMWKGWCWQHLKKSQLWINVLAAGRLIWWGRRDIEKYEEVKHRLKAGVLECVWESQ